MNTPNAHTKVDDIAAEVLAALGSGRQFVPFSKRTGGLTIEEAYLVAALLGRGFNGRGEKLVGRKIGFTNRTIWPEYGVYAPIWGYVTDRTVHELANTPVLPLAGFAEPRIEPEIVFGLSQAPAPDMDETALAGCIEWVAHGFEIVQSPFPDWKFAPADTIACNALHGALLVGPHHAFRPRAAQWLRELAPFDIALERNGVVADRGRAANVLDSPFLALRHLIAVLAEDPVNAPLAAGEIVSTGTLTRALPIAPAESWCTRLNGIALEGIK
ncbi:MAG: fumarylacetoacetate hydrolase family protein, partial [Pseudolabrys sp.]